MWVEHGQLRHFRNYEHLALDWSSQKNLFVGQNAAGKTNILEAIYCLSHGKSYRTRHDRELIQWGQPFATAMLTVQPHHVGTSHTLEAQWMLSSENQLKTLFKYNGKPVKSRSDIIGKLPTVTFFLSDLLMLRGSPQDRRDAWDRCLVQYNPVHLKQLNAYHRVRQQKSQLLKQSPERIDMDVLESLNQQLAQTGAQVMFNRVHYLQQTAPFAEIRYAELSQGQEHLTMAYQPSYGIIGEMDRLEILQDVLMRAIQEATPDEKRRGQVLVGPHRDDIRFYLETQDASLFASQGQQRSIVLALKLAEIELLKHRFEAEPPVLLLDDVMAELDPTRQEELLMHLDPAMQVFLTTTHVDSRLQWLLAQTNSVRLFHVAQGHVQPEALMPVGGDPA